MALERQQVTLEQFEAFLAQPENAERRFELIDGEIVEKMVTFKHGKIVTNIVGEFYIYLKANPIAEMAVEARHRADLFTDLLPDISVMLNGYAIPERGPVMRMPDLAVEVKSPDDRMKELRRKADYYLAHGTGIVWLVIPEKRLVTVLTADDEVFMTATDTLTGDPLLPGFTLPVADIFRGI
ncbi:MAG: Uma2 family endonuclease [Pleurocapsa minor GSE-CHR-MK-17-07R]|jgi:Uma2 family endonuclease|nr:Uma2 family endonuclease [Pleurocapsa minor GSE-CHR-MK 17-07R]